MNSEEKPTTNKQKTPSDHLIITAYSSLLDLPEYTPIHA